MIRMNRENKQVEYKREFTQEIFKTVIAFANTAGGKIFIGIEDDGSVCGVLNPNEVILQMSNSIRDNIKPDVTLFSDCYNEEIDGKNVIVVKVEKGVSRPYYHAKKGIRPEGVYVRQASSTVPASDAAILQMIKDSYGEKYEENRSLIQALTFEATTKHFSAKNLGFSIEKMKTLNLISHDNLYNNLALLLSDQCTHTIKAAVFGEESELRFKDRNEFSGSLLKQLEDSFNFLNMYNSTKSVIKGLYRVDSRAYPETALREALINAIVHREYSSPTSIQISIFPDRVEIVSFGGLVKGIEEKDITTGLSIPRNKNLANVFYRLELIEAYGSGLSNIMKAYENNVVQPEIIVTPNTFKIVLPNTFSDTGREIETKEEIIAKLFSAKKYISRKDIQDQTKMSQATTIRFLRQLLDEGIIIQIDAGRNTRYKVNIK